ncbi:MAG: hypothetical protein ABWY94_12820, partial [Pseudoxanthomonas sp.]
MATKKAAKSANATKSAVKKTTKAVKKSTSSVKSASSSESASKKATKAAKSSGNRELIAPTGDKRLIRRDAKGRIAESDDLGRS